MAGAGATLVEYDLLPGRSDAHAWLGLNGDSGVVPDVEPGPRVEGTVRSGLVEPDPHYWISYPPGTEPGESLPVVVALHGAGRTAEGWCDDLGLDRFLAASGHRMAVAAVDGGLTSFWHERSDGEDAGRMLLKEFLPLLGDRGLDLGRLGLLGWSMGGLGVLMHGARPRGAGPRTASARGQSRPVAGPRPGHAGRVRLRGAVRRVHGAGASEGSSWTCGSTAGRATRSTATSVTCSATPTSSSTGSRAPTTRRTGPGCCPASSTGLAARISAT